MFLSGLKDIPNISQRNLSGVLPINGNDFLRRSKYTVGESTLIQQIDSDRKLFTFILPRDTTDSLFSIFQRSMNNKGVEPGNIQALFCKLSNTENQRTLILHVPNFLVSKRVGLGDNQHGFV